MVSIQAPSSIYEGNELTITVNGLDAYNTYIFMFPNSNKNDIGAVAINGNTVNSEYNYSYSSYYKYHTWTPTSSTSTISIPILADNISESSESLSFYIKKNSGYGASWHSKSVQLKDDLKSGMIAGVANNIAIYDSSGSINEGDSIRFNFTGYSPYTTYYYTIDGLGSSDTTASLKSSIYMGSTGSGYLDVSIKNDQTTEGNENVTLTLYKDSNRENKTDNNFNFTVNDTSLNPVPTITLSGNTSSINEGSQATFTATNLNPRTYYYYRFYDPTGRFKAADLKNSSKLSGYFYNSSTSSINNINFTPSEDLETEGIESPNFEIYENRNYTGTPILEKSFTITDTSVTPIPTITLSGNQSTVDEGSKATFTVTNLKPRTYYYYRFSDSTGSFTSADLESGYSLSGSFYNSSISKANTIIFKPIADRKTEGIESPVLEIHTDKTFAAAPIKTKSFTVNDTSTEPKVILTYGAYSDQSNPSSINEGENISFNLSNLSRKKYYWKFEGITQEDITSDLSGIIESYYGNNLWTNYVQFNSFLDELTEGNENATFILSKEESYANPVVKTSFILTDTSRTPIPSIKINSTNIRSNEGESAIIPLTITTFPTDEKQLHWKLSGANLTKKDLATRFGDFSEQVQLSSNELPTSKVVRGTIYRTGNYTLKIPFADDNSTENTETYKLDFYESATLSGTPLNSTNITVYDTSQDPPKSFLNSATVDEKTINLYFSDPVNPRDISRSYFKITRNNKNIPIKSIQANDSNNFAELILKKEPNPEDVIFVNYLAPRKAILQAFSKKITVDDNSKPVPIRGIAYSDKIEVRFSESLQEASIHKKRFEVRSGNRNKKIKSIELEANQGILTINLLQNIDINDDSIEINYYDLRGNQSSKILEDKYGNDVDTFKNFQVSNEVSDSREIQVTLAEVEEDIITLGFDIELDSSSIPNSGMFRVMVNKNKNKIKDIVLDSDKREAYLTLKKPISNNDIVKLSYIDAKGNQKNNVIQSKYGGDLATFKNLDVENLSATSFDPPSIVDSYYEKDMQAIVIEFDEIIANTKIKRSRFKAYTLNSNGRKSRHKIMDIISSNDDTFVELMLQDPLRDSQKQLLLDYRDPKGNQKNGIVEDLQGNDFPTTKGVVIDF